MPRHPRFCPAGYPVHVIQRGNNRQVVFTSDSDIAAYAHWLKEGASKYEVSIHGWVFMTNHVHLLLTPGHDDSVSKLFQYLGRLYVRFFKLWGHPLSDDGEFLPKNKAGWAVTRTDP